MPTPRHIAIIMDGNGRWAEKRRLPRIVGHQKGVEVVQSIVAEACRLHIPYLTLYAFSSENWGRPAEEVNALMGLLERFLRSELASLRERQVQLRVIGEIERLPAGIQKILQETVEQTANLDGLVLTLALSYGGRNEIVRCFQRLGADLLEGTLPLEDLDEAAVARRLDTAGLPDPDLLIRTSGEMRISNFLLWQLAYAELFFTETLWPDFSPAELQRAIEEFSRRQRRFGLTGAQLPSDDGSREGHH